VRKLGKAQTDVLDSIRRHGSWHLGCGWVWKTRRDTERILDRLVELGYVKRVLCHPPYYTPKKVDDAAH
jgi:hypothetical protein